MEWLLFPGRQGMNDVTFRMKKMTLLSTMGSKHDASCKKLTLTKIHADLYNKTKIAIKIKRVAVRYVVINVNDTVAVTYYVTRLTPYGYKSPEVIAE